MIGVGSPRPSPVATAVIRRQAVATAGIPRLAQATRTLAATVDGGQSVTVMGATAQHRLFINGIGPYPPEAFSLTGERVTVTGLILQPGDQISLQP